MASFVNISAYQFCELKELKPLREELKNLSDQLKLKGTILLSHEGINLFVAGTAPSVETLVRRIRQIPGLENLKPKESLSEDQPFNRMLVKIKREIIAFGVSGINPAKKPAPKIAPAELKKWLDEKRPLTLLDTRNEYEIKLGTFKNAVNPHIQHFRDFPQFVDTLPEHLKQEPVVMFCTGGIRCEKAGPLMEMKGFKNIFQLEGGILKYFEEVGSQYYDGDCFVFDGRVGVDPALEETPHKLCFSCLAPLSAEDQKADTYVPGKSCSYCFQKPQEKMSLRIQERQRELNKRLEILPGEKPYQQRRPIRIPQQWEGATLLDSVSAILKHVSREEWQREIEQGLFETETGEIVRASQRVRAGERYYHVLPQASEPPISKDIRLIYEDEALVVVDKPAPLPVHPSGRFQRNTLQYLLTQVYLPQVPKPVHRLDANTTGVLVWAKTKTFARFLQKQFEEKTVEKTYWVKVQGHPETDRFVCEVPISSEVGAVGSRDVDLENGLSATTHFQVVERFKDGSALLEAKPVTGRTNQIRIHLWHLGFPVCGDPLYLPNKKMGSFQTLSTSDEPLCLHAHKIKFRHPVSRQPFEIESPRVPWL